MQSWKQKREIERNLHEDLSIVHKMYPSFELPLLAGEVECSSLPGFHLCADNLQSSNGWSENCWKGKWNRSMARWRLLKDIWSAYQKSIEESCLDHFAAHLHGIPGLPSKSIHTTKLKNHTTRPECVSISEFISYAVGLGIYVPPPDTDVARPSRNSWRPKIPGTATKRWRRHQSKVARLPRWSLSQPTREVENGIWIMDTH